MKLYRAYRRNRKGEQGYALMILLLTVALLAIAMGAAASNYKKAIQRDKEVEAIHRGVQYARAIKVFYKKFNRYPNSVNELVNTNNVRFLRKKYSDPLSPDGKWRVLHLQDVKLLGSGGGLGLGTSGGMPQNVTGNLFDNNPGSGNSQNQGGPGSTSQPIGGAVETTGGTESSSGSVFGGGNVMGGGPILGVASLRNQNGIHSFNQKTNYRDWQFIYNPQTDADRLITGPYNPNAVMGKGSNPLGTQPTPSSSPSPSASPTPQPSPQASPTTQ